MTHGMHNNMVDDVFMYDKVAGSLMIMKPPLLSGYTNTEALEVWSRSLKVD